MLRIFLIVGLVASLAAAHCSSTYANSCARCTNFMYSNLLCGWDAQNQTCQEGTPFGPGDDTSSPPYWFFSVGACCSSSTDCASCLSDSGTATQQCGWNAYSGSCEFGTSVGPRGEATPSSNWHWNSNQCGSGGDSSSSEGCKWIHWSCTACLATAGCGWEADSHSCVPGNANGPTSGSSGGDWKYYHCDSNSGGSWSFSVNSASTWTLTSCIVVLLGSVSICIRRRRRQRATVVVANGPTTAAPLVQGTQAAYA